MTFLSCKIQCPFICFCKPSPHIYTSKPLKLEDAPQQLPSYNLVSVPDAPPPHQLSAETTTDLKDESLDQKKTANCPKSNIKRPVLEPKEEAPKKKKQVQWMDFLGKELVDIREFESSDTEDMDSEGDGHKGCACVIL